MSDPSLSDIDFKNEMGLDYPLLIEIKPRNLHVYPNVTSAIKRNVALHTTL